MSDNSTNEPPGEETVDIGTTSHDAAVTINFKHGKIECTALRGKLENTSISMTVSSASGKTYEIERQPGGVYEAISWSTWVTKRK